MWTGEWPASELGAPLSSRIEEAVARGRAMHERGDADAALTHYDSALSLLEDEGDNLVAADVLRWKGLVLAERGDTSGAHGFLSRSLAMSRRIQYVCGEANSLNYLGMVAQRRGELKEAEQLYRDASRKADQCGDRRLVGMLEGNQGVIAAALGDWDAALVWLRLSLKTLEAVGYRRGAASVLNNLGVQQMQRRKLGLAVESFERALQIAYECEDMAIEATAELNLADVRVLQGDLSSASRSVARALKVAELRHDRLRLAEALRVRARIERQRGMLDTALETLRTARFQARESEDAILRMELLCDEGAIRRERGETAESRAALSRAITGFSEMGATHRAAMLSQELATL